MVREKLQELKIPCIFNVPYQPDYNPTESCLSKIKNYYKREKLKALVNNQTIDYEQLIRASVKCIEKEHISNAINSSLTLLTK